MKRCVTSVQPASREPARDTLCGLAQDWQARRLPTHLNWQMVEVLVSQHVLAGLCLRTAYPHT